MRELDAARHCRNIGTYGRPPTIETCGLPICVWLIRWTIAPGAAPIQLVDGASRLLRPDEQVFESMLDGWVNQQLARSLKRSTIEPRVALVRRFQRYTNEYPWSWRPVDIEEFIAGRVTREKPIALSTARSDAAAVRAFCDYVSDAAVIGR